MYNLVRKNLMPKGINLAKDIRDMTEKHICNQSINDYLLDTLEQLRRLLQEKEEFEKYFAKTLISIRKLLIKLPHCEVEWCKRYSTEVGITELCKDLHQKIAKAKLVLANEKNQSIIEVRKNCYAPLRPRSYLQIGVDFKNKIRCVSTEPNKSVAEIMKRAIDLRTNLLELLLDIDRRENMPEEVKGPMRRIVRKVIFCLAIDAATALRIKKSVYEVQDMVKIFTTADSNFSFRISKIQLETDAILRDSDLAAANAEDALTRIDYKGEILDQKLKKSKLQMWPYVGTVSPDEKDPDFNCAKYAGIGNKSDLIKC